MRSREHDAPAGVGADHALAHGIVGIGGALPTPPRTIDEAVEAAAETHDAKTARMLRHFADLDEGALVWTRTADHAYHLGRIAGPWRYDDSPEARAVGIHQRSAGDLGGPALRRRRGPGGGLEDLRPRGPELPAHARRSGRATVREPLGEARPQGLSGSEHGQ